MRLLLIASVALVAAVAPATASAQQSKPCTPGTAGVGDQYYPGYGNGGYDVRHYDLDVDYNPGNDRLRGDASLRVRAEKNLCSFNLDFVGLQVQSITVDGRRAQWRRQGQELTVLPRRPVERGRFDVRVRYAGIPSEFTLPGLNLRTGWMTTPEGVTVAGQPEVAAAWYPVNDHPLDKASYNFNVTVPRGYEVAANGFLRGQSQSAGKSTWRWDAPEPMASYLATIDVSDWDVTRSRQAGLPVYDAVDNRLTGELRRQIDSSLARQGEVIDLLSASFGPYPFRTAGGIVPNQDDLRFALETQTRSVYSKLFWLDRQGNPENGDSVVVHETAHQWFGDDVALGRWQDIWLNEGFASWAEWLWAEHEGQGTTQETFKATYDSIPADDPFWQLKIGDPGVDHLFDEPVYTRGAMAVQALRNEVGDEAFFRILKRWTRTKGGGNGTTPEFIALAERVAGRELDEVFDTWLFTAGKPAFSEPQAGAAPQAQQRSLRAGKSFRGTVQDRLKRVKRY